MTIPDQIRAALTRGLGAVVVHTRRPEKLFRIDVPAYSVDGDVHQVYVEPRGNGFHVTDMGATLLRASYAGELTDSQQSEASEAASQQGLSLDDGALGVVVSQSDLFAAVIGLVQAEVAVEAVVARSQLPKRMRSEEDYRSMVIGVLSEALRGRIQFDFAQSNDKDKDFAIDAFIDGPRPIGLAIVANDVNAERAIGSRFNFAQSKGYANVEWLSLPRDVSQLSKRTRRRLDHAFEPLVTAFDIAESDVVIERILRRAA